MKGVGRGRAHLARKATLANMEEKTMEFVPPPDGATAAEGEEEPVVRPKMAVVSGESQELSDLSFFKEMREFMR